MDQRVTIGMHLSSKNNEGLRGWLCCASDKTFETWVWKFFGKDDVQEIATCVVCQLLTCDVQKMATFGIQEIVMCLLAAFGS